MAEGKTITIIQKGKAAALPTISISPSSTIIDISNCEETSPDGSGGDRPIYVTPSDKSLKWQIHTNFFLQLSKVPCCVCKGGRCASDCDIAVPPGNDGIWPDDNLSTYIFTGDQTFYPLHYGDVAQKGNMYVRYLDYKDIQASATVTLKGRN